MSQKLPECNTWFCNCGPGNKINTGGQIISQRCPFPNALVIYLITLQFPNISQISCYLGVSPSEQEGYESVGGLVKQGV